MADQRAGLATLTAFMALAGAGVWSDRMAELRRAMAAGPYMRRALQQRHGLELALDRLRRVAARPRTGAETHALDLAAETVALSHGLTAPGQTRLAEALRAALQGEQTLVPLFHMLRTAALQRTRGFTVSFPGLEEGASFDLLLRRDGVEAEVICDVVSAEEGRGVHRGAWVRLVDRIDPDLQTWLAAHPGRYLLKLTLPQGLRTDAADQDQLAALHGRIRTLLAAQRRADHDEDGAGLDLALAAFGIGADRHRVQLAPAMERGDGGAIRRGRYPR